MTEWWERGTTTLMCMPLSSADKAADTFPRGESQEQGKPLISPTPAATDGFSKGKPRDAERNLRGAIYKFTLTIYKCTLIIESL